MNQPRRYEYGPCRHDRATPTETTSPFITTTDRQGALHPQLTATTASTITNSNTCLTSACTRVTNSLGHVWHYHYDEDHLPVKVVDGNGAATIYDYDEVGRVAAVTDPLERITRYEYDEAGNILEITRPDDSRIAMAYDDRHRPVQIMDPGRQYLGTAV